MSPAKRLFANETFKSFDSQGKLPARKRALGTQTTRAQAFQVFRHEVFRSVNDAQLLRPAALDGELRVSASALADEL